MSRTTTVLPVRGPRTGRQRSNRCDVEAKRPRLPFSVFVGSYSVRLLVGDHCTFLANQVSMTWVSGIGRSPPLFVFHHH